MNSFKVNFSLVKDLLKLFDFLGRKRIFYFILLQFLTIFSSIFEMISVGSIAPFIAIVTNVSEMRNNIYVSELMIFFEMNSDMQLINFSAIVFCSFLFFSNFVKWFITYINMKFTTNVANQLALKLYTLTLHQPYIIHTQRNSSEFVIGISKASELIQTVVNPIFILVNSIFTVVFVGVFLIYLNPLIISLTLGVLTFSYLIISIVSRNMLKIESRKIVDMNPVIHKYVQEGISGIREIILDGSQHFFSQRFGLYDGFRRMAQLKIFLISNTPNSFMQVLGITLISFLTINLGQGDYGNSNLPFLGVIAFGFLRISPAISSIYSNWVLINSGKASLDYILYFFKSSQSYLERDLVHTQISFKHSLALNNVSFRYNEKFPYVLKNLSLQINKGDKIGLAGVTGKGKSTLADIIMGLLDPSNGFVEVDGTKINQKNLKSWQSHIAHVPQTIFLSDSSISENIAFGIPEKEIDHEKVVHAARKAQISSTIEQWESGYNTLVGERGVRLSGGQRQRIGIARALYKDADVIVFDEATSALDNETELEVINAINSLSKDLTIIIIAHRLSTLKICDKIYELKDNYVIDFKTD
jgi:ABC-type multidrug transport system fused ATPase/permease subunit